MAKSVFRVLKKTRVLIPLSISVIFLSVFVLLPLVNINLGQDNVFGVKLLSVAPTQTELPDTNCYIKTTGSAYKDFYVNIKNSQMLTKHPIYTSGQKLSLVDLEDVKEPIQYFKLAGKIRCDSNPNQTFILDSANLNYQVLSQNKDLKKITTYSKSVQITNDITLNDNKEETINIISINAADIEKNLPSKEYNAYHEFRTSGKLVIYYKNYPTVKYTIDVPEDSIRVYYNTFVTNSPDQITKQNCTDGKIYVDGACVKPSEPLVCEDGEELVDGVCKKPTGGNEGKPNQEDPKVQSLTDIQSLLTEWFLNLVTGNFQELQNSKFIGIDVLVGLLLFLVIISALRPKKV